jgi:hypothetical protein
METTISTNKKKWVKALKFILEGSGIILSIIIAFTIENWDEDQKKLEKQDFYLQSVYSDLNKDFLELNRRVSEYQQKIKQTNDLLNLLSQENCDEDKVISIINKNLTYIFPYVPFNHTYEALESSGDIKLIRNEKLKLLFFELDKSFHTTTLYGNRFLDYTNGIMWAGYLLNNIDYLNRKVYENRLSETQERLEFYSRTKRLHELLETYYYNMQGTLLKIVEVREVLELELKQNNIPFEAIEINGNKSVEQNEENEFEDLLNDL